MAWWTSRAGFALLIGLGATAAASAADQATSKPAAATNAPDFAGYVAVTTVTGEVVKADDQKVTLRIFWQKVSQSRSGSGGNRGRGRGPALSRSGGRGTHSPYATRRPNVKVTWEHRDYDLPFLPESLVRTKTLPPKTDPNGKKGFYSPKEQDELKAPFSVPGYQASKGDLTPGTVVEAYIIRDRSIPPGKVTDADMRIKYAVIIGQDSNAAKNLSDTSKTPQKKKN